MSSRDPLQLDPAPPLVPLDLDEHGARMWAICQEELERRGRWSRTLQAPLEMLVESWSGYRRTLEVLRRDGDVIEGPNGIQRHPAVIDHHRYKSDARRLAQDLGLSLFSAARPAPEQVEDEEDGQPLAKVRDRLRVV